MINGIKQFSSSLICLSLDLTDLIMLNINAFPFNNFQLEIFFESIKQFHQDLKINFGLIIIFHLECMEHIYTFHQDYLYEFSSSFQTIK
jgi:hypothetical protein